MSLSKDAISKLLDSIRTREECGGIATAKFYLKSVAPCLSGEGICPTEFFGAEGGERWAKELAEADSRLTFSGDGMTITKAKCGCDDCKDGKACPCDGKKKPEKKKGIIAEFDCVMTTPVVDRDGDIVVTKGLTFDERMPLLWHHMLVQPVGKFIKLVRHDDEVAIGRFGIIGTKMGEDVALLAEHGALRTSIGFIPKELAPRETFKKGGETKVKNWHIKKAHVHENSMVSVPANQDVVLTQFSRKSLQDDLVNQWAKALFDARPAQASGFDVDELGEKGGSGGCGTGAGGFKPGNTCGGGGGSKASGGGGADSGSDAINMIKKGPISESAAKATVKAVSSQLKKSGHPVYVSKQYSDSKLGGLNSASNTQNWKITDGDRGGNVKTSVKKGHAVIGVSVFGKKAGLKSDASIEAYAGKIKSDLRQAGWAVQNVKRSSVDNSGVGNVNYSVTVKKGVVAKERKTKKATASKSLADQEAWVKEFDAGLLAEKWCNQHGGNTCRGGRGSSGSKPSGGGKPAAAPKASSGGSSGGGKKPASGAKPAPRKKTGGFLDDINNAEDLPTLLKASARAVGAVVGRAKRGVSKAIKVAKRAKSAVAEKAAGKVKGRIGKWTDKAKAKADAIKAVVKGKIEAAKKRVINEIDGFKKELAEDLGPLFEEVKNAASTISDGGLRSEFLSGMGMTSSKMLVDLITKELEVAQKLDAIPEGITTGEFEYAISTHKMMSDVAVTPGSFSKMYMPDLDLLEGSWEWCQVHLHRSLKSYLAGEGKCNEMDSCMISAMFDDHAIVCCDHYTPGRHVDYAERLKCYRLAWEKEDGKPMWSGDCVEVEVKATVIEKMMDSHKRATGGATLQELAAIVVDKLITEEHDDAVVTKVAKDVEGAAGVVIAPEFDLDAIFS